jgi:hypothetical protein
MIVDRFIREVFIERFHMNPKGSWFVRLPYFYQPRKSFHREFPLSTEYEEFERKLISTVGVPLKINVLRRLCFIVSPGTWRVYVTGEKKMAFV